VDVLRLLGGSLVLRPYVFAFLVVYLFAAVTRMGWARTGAFTAIAWAVAYAAEFSSTRTGFPFGLYHYVDTTRGRELWLANVPFFDSLSFTFLCYVGHAMAVLLAAPSSSGAATCRWRTPLRSARRPACSSWARSSRCCSTS
jgi:putative membrane protein